jgi:hypothetical protein
MSFQLSRNSTALEVNVSRAIISQAVATLPRIPLFGGTEATRKSIMVHIGFFQENYRNITTDAQIPIFNGTKASKALVE